MRVHWNVRRKEIPRQVDPIQRRERIALAVIEIMASRGIEEVSLRDVAAEAGCSMGMVQHYFSTKDDMLVFASGYLADRILHKVSAEIAEASGIGTARAALRITMLHLLPLDEERRREARVWLAFLARATVRPELTPVMREARVVAHDFFLERVRAAIAAGELPPSRDANADARSLHAFADGMVGLVITGVYSADEAEAAIDHQLNLLFGSAAVLSDPVGGEWVGSPHG